MIRTSAWLPASTVRHDLQVPHPVPVSHWSAAAKATAALERPDPGGPVKSQAWVIPSPPAARLQRLDHRPLADQVVPHRHGSSTSTRARMAAAISSIGARASSTT